MHCVKPLNELLYEDMEEYLQREEVQGVKLFTYIPTIDPDLSPRTCWLLQQSFASNVLPWLPLFPQDHCVRNLEEAIFSGFDLDHPPSSLTLFVLAIGALIRRPDDTDDVVEGLAGIEYFHKGCKGLDVYSRREHHSIVTVQSHILSWYVVRSPRVLC